MSRDDELVNVPRPTMDKLAGLLADGHEHDERVAAAGRRAGREEMIRDLAAEARAEKTTQHDLLRALRAAEPEDRWNVRGQQRTRETFAQSHPRDYLGRQREAEAEREAG